jgi:hypothetical protein
MAVNGYALRPPSLPQFTYLHELGFELGVLLCKFSRAVQRIEHSAIPLGAIGRIEDKHIGLFYSFLSSCWAKNIPSYTRLKRGWSPSGTCLKDPHLHFRHSDTKVLLAIDPRWLTTSTTFHDLTGRGKTATLSGLIQLKQIDKRANLAVCTPLIFGLPYGRG